MQIDTLREYIEFAKYLNFSVAAKKLFISQPALSNHIAGLEKELGVELVRRDHNLELTAAGKAFFEGSCEVVASYDTVLERIRSLASSHEKGTLKIKMSLDEGQDSLILIEAIGHFKRENPAVSIKFVKDGKNSIIDDLVHGAVDCVQLFNFSSKYYEAGLPEVECLVLDRVPITVAAHKDHPLMAKEHVAFADIQEYPYAMPAGAGFIECDLSVRHLYEERGFSLKKVHYKAVDSITDLIFSGIAGDEMLILGPSPKLPKDLAYRSFEPEIFQEYCLVYLKDNQNPALNLFIESIRHQPGEGNHCL